MSRTIVNVQETSNNQFFFWLYSALGNIAGFATLCPLTVINHQVFQQVKQGPLQVDTIKLAGQCLYQDLATHQAVQQAMQQALAIPPGTQNIAPIYLHIVDGNEVAEELPWETLSTPQGQFLALDRRWPIGRIASSSTTLSSNAHPFRSPLRLMAFLAAAGVDATEEWRALYRAVNASPLQVELRVFVCQDNLKTEIDNLNSNFVRADFLPTDLNRLEQEIRAFSPNILHFFCHGSTQGGPHLQLASRADYQVGKLHGSVTLDASQITQIPNITQYAWLITLNCCQGAAATADVSSLARQLVVDGISAVLGMRETVTSNDANLLCESLYSAILPEIQNLVTAGNTPRVTIEWATMLRESRRQLAQQHGPGQPLASAAAGAKEWTLPVIYVRPEVFELEVVQPVQPLTQLERLERQATLGVLRKYYEDQIAQPDLPAEALAALAEIKAKIDELEQQLA